MPEPGRDVRADLIRKQARLSPLPEPANDPEAKKAAELHDRETVSQYLARFAIEGEVLFDALVARRTLGGQDRDRNFIRHPRNLHQIREALRIIELGEWGDLRWDSA